MDKLLFCDREIPEETANAVNMAIRSGRLPQSVMLSGGSAALREKCAAELCLAALCPNISPGSPFPCGECSACKRIRKKLHPDVTRVIPDGKKKTVSIENIREQVLKNLYVSPTEAAAKVYIFPDADTLSVQIQNALLKTIEEPPETAMFIFCCEQREKLLTTVISRLTEYSLGDTLSSGSRTEDDNAVAIARELAVSLSKDDEYSLFLQTAPMQKNRKLISLVASKLIEIVRDALCEGSGASLLSDCDTEAFALAASFGASSLIKIKQAMDSIVSDAAANANENLLITKFSSSLAVIMKERRA